MIHFVYGLAGSGKTDLITKKIQEDARTGRKSLLIVPEQQTVDVERTMLALLPPAAQLTFEAVNFTRLANKVFRRFGGLSYHYATPGIKHLLMWKTLDEVTGMLLEYGARISSDTALPAMMLSQINELKAYAVSATALESAAKRVPEGSSLRNKLMDISLVYAVYEGMLRECFDDTADDLTKLAEIIESHRCFDGYEIYIDGFTSFTAQEHRIIRSLFSQAENVTVALSIDSPDTSALELISIKETAKQLMEDAGTDTKITILDQLPRFSSPELSRVATSLWRFEAATKNLAEIPEEKRGAITVLRCESPYAEAEAAANTVLSLLQKGYRRREIAVIARDANQYRGIIDSAFEKAGVPFFLSEKADLNAKPLVTMLLSALNIQTRNWRTADVLSYIKSGIPDIPVRDLDIFENYVSIWNISGAKFLEDLWVMNPNGYTASVTPRSEEMLETANRVRRQLTLPLSRLFLALKNAENVRGYCEALRHFLEETNAAERMKEYAIRSLKQGDKKDAAENAATFRAVITALSDMASALGDQVMKLDEFAAALRLLFANTEIGSIPTAADEVLIGSASMMRASGIRCAILLGMCDGEFPARVSETGFFSDHDKRLLSELGISFSADTKQSAAEELLYCYRALTIASDKLFVMYHDTTSAGKACFPSLAVRRICELLPHVKPIAYGTASVTDRLMCPALSFEALPSLRTTSEYGSVLSVLSEDPTYAGLIKRSFLPVGNANSTVKPETAELAFGKNLNLTQSRLDSYVSCHFAHYGKYALKLMENGKAEFHSADTGTFIHRILEVFMKSITDENGLRKDVPFDEIRRTVIRETERFIAEISPAGRALTARVNHLFKRLCRLAVAVIVDLYKEFQDSEFVPAFFEAEIGPNSEYGIDAPVIKLQDGSHVQLYGKIDRIDVFRQGNCVYIRVIDYKTGQKEFSFSDIEEGLNIQLLLYLFAVCQSNSSKLKERVSASSDDRLLPAGAFYVSSHLSPLKLEKIMSEQDAIALAGSKFSRSGILLDQEDIRSATGSVYLPPEKSRAKKRPTTMLGLDAMTALEDQLKQTITRIALEIKSGDAATCATDDKNAPCKYCKLRSVCRVAPHAYDQDEQTEED